MQKFLIFEEIAGKKYDTQMQTIEYLFNISIKDAVAELSETITSDKSNDFTYVINKIFSVVHKYCKPYYPMDSYFGVSDSHCFDYPVALKSHCIISSLYTLLYFKNHKTRIGQATMCTFTNGKGYFSLSRHYNGIPTIKKDGTNVVRALAKKSSKTNIAQHNTTLNVPLSIIM